MRGLVILGLCMGAAFICACAFLGMLWFNLPPTDAAYHSPPFAFLADPFFLAGAMAAAIFVGLVSFPFVYFAIRKLRLLTTTLFVFGIVLSEIVIVTPFQAELGLHGSLAALASGLVVARFSRWSLFAPNEVRAENANNPT